MHLRVHQVTGSVDPASGSDTPFFFVNSYNYLSFWWLVFTFRYRYEELLFRIVRRLQELNLDENERNLLKLVGFFDNGKYYFANNNDHGLQLISLKLVGVL